MAEGVLFNIAHDILKHLGSRALEEIAAAWGFKAPLNRLTDTITTVKDVLLDAQERQVESPAIRGWLQRLQSAVYSADDLFDEFATLASKNEAMEGNKNKMINKVQTFFSGSNPVALAFSISQKIKSIRKELDVIVQDGHQFSFVLRHCEERDVLIRQQLRDQTHSFVNVQDVIGRDEDKKAILEILLTSSSSEEPVSVVPIVGMGGLGKTTLAQLAFNDEMVKQHFELRLWVCVSEDFGEKEITRKILMSAINVEPQNLDMDQLQSRLREAIGGRKYLLVLDDVWNENREKWLKLSPLLKTGKMGSKILVTTRSREVASIMGDVCSYDLEGLSDERSWALFQKMAFKPGQEDSNPRLVEAGKDIIEKCGNVPLAIRTLGSLLYGKNESKWLSVKHSESLAKISDSSNNIMPILKLSYNQLTSPLKNCFAYCALFPKDFEFPKETLISLWMAEGFLIPMDGSGSQPAEVGEDYFFTLVQRCFFQDIRVDEWDNVRSCKIHDLMHDLAQEVAGVESNVAKLGVINLEKRSRRLSLGYRLNSTQSVPRCMLDLKLLRTLLLPGQIQDGSVFSKSICHQLILSFRCLRVLDLNNLGVKVLPNSIGKLIHMRYLDLSYTPIKTLPSSITNLQNLRTLNLYSCNNLRSLPKDVKKLTNLRSLDVGKCSSLYLMPSGMGELTSLQKLSRFVATSSRSASVGLRELKNLNSLRGDLDIIIVGVLKDPEFEAKEANLSSKHGLNKLAIYFYLEREQDEAVLEGLKPPENLKVLKIRKYDSEKLPSWALKDKLSVCLPHLVEIDLEYLRCQQLPLFSQLPFLKRLYLLEIERVEFMESTVPLSAQGTPLFFPSLQIL